MASPEKAKQPFILSLALTVLLVWGIVKLWNLYESPYQWVLWVLGIMALASGFQVLGTVLSWLHNLRLIREAYTKTQSKGSSAWASPKELKRNGLYSTNGLFLGVHTNGHPIFFNGETHGLTLSPAGGGKTVCMATPALCHAPESMIVTDLKGTLAYTTKELRQKKHKHEVYCVNPARLYVDKLGEPARVNPVQVLIDDWEDPMGHKDLVADAQDMALQLHPDPPVQGENLFFRNGSRKLLTFGLLYLVTLSEKKATLGNLLRLLRNLDEMMEAFYIASCSDLLNGELADMAKDLLSKFQASDNQRQTESFREGAVQSLEAFAPSGWLEESTSTCDFRFKDLKAKKITVYLIADPTKMKVFAPWLGLLGWAAIRELTRCRSVQPILFLLDEACNTRIEGLASSLTALREFGIRCWFLLQEPEDFISKMGRPAWETVLSQTEVKQFFGVQSQKTAELVSKMLGEETIKSPNYSLGHDHQDKVQKSISESSRRLLTPDEVRRFPDMILFIRNMKPIHAHKVGYHEVHPWSKWVDINPLHGKKLKGKIRLKLRY